MRFPCSFWIYDLSERMVAYSLPPGKLRPEWLVFARERRGLRPVAKVRLRRV